MLAKPRPMPRNWPGMIVGAGVLGHPQGRQRQASVEPASTGSIIYAAGQADADGRRTPALTDAGASHRPDRYWIVDDSRTQVWQYDSTARSTSPSTCSRTTWAWSAAIGDERIRAGPAARRRDPHQGQGRACRSSAKARDRRIAAGRATVVAASSTRRRSGWSIRPTVQTWEESQATWLGAVEKEKVLVTFLFGIISVVAIFLIFCIFYMIVVEKTQGHRHHQERRRHQRRRGRDLPGLWRGHRHRRRRRWGCCVGYLIVHNINYLHDAAGPADRHPDLEPGGLRLRHDPQHDEPARRWP